MADFMQELYEVEGILGDAEFAEAALRSDQVDEDASAKATHASATVDPATELQQEEELGWKVEVRRLYSEDACGCCTTWTSKVPMSAKKTEVKEEISHRTKKLDETFAIVHRQMLHGEGKHLLTYSIDVNCPKLKAVLLNVFEDYPGIDINSTTMSFRPPFKPFVHRWDRLELEDEQGSAGEQLKLLKQILRKELESSFLTISKFEKAGYIAFADLTVGFLPGDVVIHRSNDGTLSAGILRTVREENYWSRCCCFEVDVIDWNGEKCGYREDDWRVYEYEGERQATTLDVFPLRIHPEKERIRQTLVSRGKLFETLRGQYIRRYEGTCESTKGWWQAASRQLSERIVVDAFAYYKFQDKTVPTLTSLNKVKRATTLGLSALESVISKSDSSGNVKQEEPLGPMTDDQRLLAVPYVLGFALESKEWHKFDVTGVKNLQWDKKAFENVVLDADSKELLLALVSSNKEIKEIDFDDFVTGKGQGVILLLHGPAGVGKTLTAETVSEQVMRPLYRLGAGDLGTSAYDVETSLKKALDVCAHWNAVLLIDEADVYLESRSMDSLQRNELVSIFLRLLEYYRGIMILTTNRISSIDAAFGSRIDLILTYESLSTEAQAQIWRNFIKRLPAKQVLLSDEDILELSRRNLNGREIKSAIKTGLIVAAKADKPLCLRHVQTVLNVRERSSQLLSGKL